MAIQIKAPAEVPTEGYKLFLAGTIDQGHSEDWQKTVSENLSQYDVVLINPRRDEWDENASEELIDGQIRWEQDALKNADFRIFVFLADSKSPVTFLELGEFIEQPGAVCVEPGFWRKQNIDVTCEEHKMPVFDSIDDLVKYVKVLLDEMGLKRTDKEIDETEGVTASVKSAAISPSDRVLYHGTGADTYFTTLRPNHNGLIFLGEKQDAADYSRNDESEPVGRIFQVTVAPNAKIVDLRDLSDPITRQMWERSGVAKDDWNDRIMALNVLEHQRWARQLLLKNGVDAVIVKDRLGIAAEHDSLAVLNPKVIQKTEELKAAAVKVASPEDLDILKSELTLTPAQKGEELARNYTQDFREFIENQHPELEEHLPADEDDYIDDYSAFPPKVLTEFLDQYGPEYAKYADAPTFLTVDFERDVNDEWLVHFSDHASAIAQQGFKYGMDDPRTLALTTQFTDAAKQRGGYNFAFSTAQPSYYLNGTKYGRDCVVFKASGIMTFHYGDNEPQVIFWGADAHDIVPILRDRNSDYWTLYDGDDNVLFESGKLGEAIDWVEENYELYRAKQHTSTPVTASAASTLPTFDQWLEHAGGVEAIEDEWGNSGGGWVDVLGNMGLPTDQVPEDYSGAEYRAFAEREMGAWLRNERWPYVMEELERWNFPKEVYRAVTLKGGVKDLRTDQVGVYWATSLSAALPHWGESRDYHVLKAVVSSDQVDWLGTLDARMNYWTGDDEEEIRLKPGVVLNDVTIADEDQEQPVGQLVTAATQPAQLVDTSAFKAWFGNSKVVDTNGGPLLVHRGEHGEYVPDQGFQSREPSLSFGSEEAAHAYATSPNDRRDTTIHPRVHSCYLRIENPFVNETEDPFVDFTHIISALSQDRAIYYAIKYADHITNTNNWSENFADEGLSVQQLLSQRPEVIESLYMDLYPLLADPEFVGELKAKGYDGAIHGGNGETALEAEYKVFDQDQVWRVDTRSVTAATQPVVPPDSGFKPWFNDMKPEDWEATKQAPPAGDVTATPEFKAWFSRSKVVDTDGNPLIAFHGTSSPSKKFIQTGRGDYAGLGHWFDASPYAVHNYAGGESKADNPNLMPVYLRIENPKEYASFNDLADVAQGKFGPTQRARVLKLRKDLKKEGYDGVVIRNSVRDSSMPDYWVAFDTKQIKSAIGNSGEFADPKNIMASASRWFHGTSKENAKKILAAGELRPGMERNSGGEQPQENAVYITSDLVIAEHYAEDGVVLEVKVEPGDTLLPDEDSIGELLEEGNLNGNDHYFGEVLDLFWMLYGGDPAWEHKHESVREIGNSPMHRYLFFKVLKQTARTLAKQKPELAQQIITESGKAAHIGPVKVLGVVGPDGNLKKKPKLLTRQSAAKSFYHVSRVSNRASIQASGLQPRVVEFPELGRKPGVYLLKTLAQARDWAYYFGLEGPLDLGSYEEGDMIDPDPMDIWAVSVNDPSKLVEDTTDMADVYNSYVSYETFPPESLKLVETLTDFSRAPKTPRNMRVSVLAQKHKAAEAAVDNPAFQTWFRGSKVVDSKGNPLVVYHGTDQTFDVFEPRSGMRGDGGIFVENVTSPFFFFTPDAGYANRVADMKGGRSGKVMSVYLRMVHPLDLRTPQGLAEADRIYGVLQDAESGDIRVKREAVRDAMEELEQGQADKPEAFTRFVKYDNAGNVIAAASFEKPGYVREDVSLEQATKWHNESLAEEEQAVREAQTELEKAIEAAGEIPHAVWQAFDEPDAAHKLEKAGYDGLIFHENDGTLAFAVCRSNQIKSTRNSGTFDLANPRITASEKSAIPRGLEGLAAEARKCNTFEEFKHDFLRDLKHGIYWHLTNDSEFRVDPAKGPRDMSSMADGLPEPGKLMITSHLGNWDAYYNEDEDRGVMRPHAALIDMSAVPRNAYHQVSRGFGNEFMVTDPSQARVAKVMTIEQARVFDQRYEALLNKNINSDRDLRRFWETATGKAAKQASPDFDYSLYNNREDELRRITFKYEGDDDEIGVGAHLDGRCITVMYLVPWEDRTSGRVDVSGVDIPSEWRGTGLGQMLYDAAIQVAKKLGYRHFCSDADLSEAAISAWKRVSKRYPVIEEPNRATITDGEREGQQTSCFCVDLSKVPSKNIRLQKLGFVSARDAELSVTIKGGERPSVSISLDLGLPNFTRFNISVPVAGLANEEIDAYCRQAYDALLDDVTAFLISVGYTEEYTLEMLEAAEMAFIELGAGDATDADMPDQDRGVRLYEGKFQLPESFLEETHSRMVTAAANMTETPAFKRWFGNSKVVDDKGRPLPVYHGTKADFDTFDLSMAGSNNDPGMWGTGFYFSPQIRMSRGYGDKMMRVYLSLQNPLIIGDGHPMPEALVEMKTFRKESPMLTKEKANAIRELLIGMGYDGVMQYSNGWKYPAQIVAFYPNQIKAVKGNSGQFDPNSHSIAASVVRRVPEIRELELIPIDVDNGENSPIKTIDFFKDQITKSTPRPFNVLVFDGEAERLKAAPKPGDWEGRLLDQQEAGQESFFA